MNSLIFTIGLLLGLVIGYYIRRSTLVGDMIIVKEDDYKDIYRLELRVPVEDLASKKRIAFEVKK